MSRVFLISCMVFAIISCAPSTDETLNRVVSYQLLSDAICPSLDKSPTARLIKNQTEYKKLTPAARSLGGTPPATVDFSRHDVLLVSMGEKPTAGYSLKLGPRALTQQDKKLLLDVEWKTPSASAAQVITYPCLQLAIEKSQARFLLVIDQQGGVVLNTRLR